MSNQALEDALEAKGITTEKDLRRFADSIGMHDRTLRRWMNGGAPNAALGRIVARKLGVKYDDLWPKEKAA